MDGKPCALSRRSAAAIPTVTSTRNTTIRVRCRTWCSASVRNSLVPCLHCLSAVRLICADAAKSGILGAGFGARCGMRKGTCPLELSEYGFFVGEEITDKAVGVAFMHGQVRIKPWAQDTGGKVVSESRNEVFISGSEFY